MNTCHIVKTKTLTEKQKLQVLQLWNSEYPKELEHASLFVFETYLSNLLDVTHYVIEDACATCVAWAFVFDRDEERWFGIILSRAIQGKGLGKHIMQEIQAHELELNGWVIDHENSYTKDGQPYVSPLPFYEKIGFNVLTDIRLELPHISAVKIHWKKKPDLAF